MENSSGRASARTCACSNGSSIAANKRAGPSNRQWAGYPLRMISILMVSKSITNLSPIFSESITRNGKKNSPNTRSFSTRSAVLFRRNYQNSANNSSRGLRNKALSSRVAETTRGLFRAIDHPHYPSVPQASWARSLTSFGMTRAFIWWKFANRLTGSEYFQWVRRLRAENISGYQSRRISLRFVGHARTISKGSMSTRSEEHTSELQSRFDLVCRLLLEKKKKKLKIYRHVRFGHRLRIGTKELTLPHADDGERRPVQTNRVAKSSCAVSDPRISAAVADR